MPSTADWDESRIYSRWYRVAEIREGTVRLEPPPLNGYRLPVLLPDIRDVLIAPDNFAHMVTAADDGWFTLEHEGSGRVTIGDWWHRLACGAEPGESLAAFLERIA